MAKKSYTEDDIETMEWVKHLRERPGMYVGSLGDGSGYHDCVYIMIKEIVDNGVDEFIRGHGKRIDVTVGYDSGEVTVRDYGDGIPLGKVVDCVSKMNTSAKFRDSVYQFSAGMNGVGSKAVNALSEMFEVRSVRDGEYSEALFREGRLVSEKRGRCPTSEPDGTMIHYRPDTKCLHKFVMREEYVVRRMKMYAYVHPGLKIVLNGGEIHHPNGLSELVADHVGTEGLYRPFAGRLKQKDSEFEFVFTHTNRFNDEFHTFVNGQYTTDGGVHLSAFKEAVTKALNEFDPKRKFDGDDVRSGIFACIALKMNNPNFIGQTKVKLGNSEMRSKWVQEWKKLVFEEFHRHPEETAKLIAKVAESSRLHGEMNEIKKKAKKLSAAAVLNIPKLKECREHLRLDRIGDKRGWGEETMIFLTEGDSAGGTVSRARDARYQAVYPLRGKVKNMTDKDRKEIFENKELYNMVRALGVQDDLEHLRYGKIVLATDADVDGLHIRNLLITFFMRFFRPLVADGRVHILETPLYRVRKDTGKQKETIYCYSDEEREAAVRKLGAGADITRFKGLGEINPEDFSEFIGEDIRLSPVICTQDINPDKSLEFYMGDNTPERKDYIMSNLICTEDDFE